MNGRYVFDTNIILDFLKQDPVIGAYLATLQGATILASVITRIELLSFHALDAREKGEITNLLSTCVIVPLSKSVEDAAIAFRCQTRRKTPDSIIAATALCHNATLITGDVYLASVTYPGLKVINPRALSADSR